MAKSTKIKQVINSTKKTAVITQAMELVSASKLPKALSHLNNTKTFADLAALAMGNYCEYSNLPHFQPLKDDKHHIILVVGSDRGLCGSLNLHLFKQVLQKIHDLEQDGKKVSLALCGSKAIQFFSDKANIIGQIEHLGDKPELQNIMKIMHPIISNFEDRVIDCIHIASNRFESTLVQQPSINQVLPMVVEQIDDAEHYIYEPCQDEVITTLFRYYTESLIYRTIIENIACEQASRMIAMKNATDNAEDIIQSLNLTYNKIRQASITQEIAEISAGALYADGESL